MSQTGMEDNLYTADQFIEIFGSVIADALKKLRELQPSVGIVRCKDCKFYSPMNRENKTGICNLTMHQNFGDDWFCAGAERRTDETD